ncbi:MAG: BolA family protein, partial [Pseudolabrys sp.]
RPGGQTHYRVYIVSDAFKGKTRIERHRMINQSLAAELAGGVHALAIHASAPGESGN